MIHNRMFKVVSNIVLLLALSAGQIAASPNKAVGDEAAVVTTPLRDIVLVFDTSASMAFETDGNPFPSEGDDPKACNISNTCQPMKAVKDAALDFIDTLHFVGYDRVAIVTMTSQRPDKDRNPRLVLPLNSDKATIVNAINAITVFEPRVCDPSNPDIEGSCIRYLGGVYDPVNDVNIGGTFVNGDYCDIWQAHIFEATADPSSCPSSNVGGALRLARSAFTDPDYTGRPDALWMVVALVGGPANATDVDGNYPPDYPNGYCPRYTWTYKWPGAGGGFCRDMLPSTRHHDTDPLVPYINPVTEVVDPHSPISYYDADDYARDMADSLATLTSGEGVTIFTIGLGAQVQKTGSSAEYYPPPNETVKIPPAEALLQYIAECAGEGVDVINYLSPTEHVCTTIPVINHGQYFFAPNASSLVDIFQVIADLTVCSPAIAVVNNQNVGAGSLRQATWDICPGGVITFDLPLSGQTISLASPLTIDKDVTIDGSALASKISISGDNSVPVFEIALNTSATLTNLIITKGKSVDYGGGIRNLGTLSLANSIISGNYGGGIHNLGILNITSSTISNNSSYYGGGILNLGESLQIENSTITGNSATEGGGIYNASSLNLINSTVSNNLARGGGIISIGTVNIANSTFSGNSSSEEGGGILNYGPLTISNSTFSDNSAATWGGGIYNGNGPLNLTNTIIANSISGGDCYNDSVVSAIIGININNLVVANAASPNNCGNPTFAADPKLGSLANNGGFTQTMALTPGSPAINTGDDTNCPATDQRGIARPQGAHCDIGAYEIIQTFSDVTTSHWAYSYIERLYNASITGGCSAIPLNYCPAISVTRAQMAIFLVRAMHGIAFVPPSATGVFDDVPVGSFGADYIEQLATDGITSGCGGGNFCPNSVVTRTQMAIFLVRAKHGIAFTPPTATGIFIDVPVGSFGADYIEQLVADGITSGCGTGIYCPTATVKRDSMAVFLVRTFNLP
ncbi:MAG: S-layer homology domain-containing protein [Chloroflexi bacterium]|nr:S-layer homology domain-containing protein [Chloroflexota bacterium]